MEVYCTARALDFWRYFALDRVSVLKYFAATLRTLGTMGIGT